MMHTDFQEFLKRSKEFGEFELTPVQQDFITVCKNIDLIQLDSIIPIHKDIFHASGYTTHNTNNIIFKSFKEIDEQDEDIFTEGSYYNLFAFKPNNSDEWVYLLIDDYIIISDIFYFFKKIFNTSDVENFFEEEAKKGHNEMLKENYDYLTMEKL